MIRKVKKQVAGVNNCSAMETEIIQKNGASPKSQMSRVNLLKKAVLFFIGICLICLVDNLWGQKTIDHDNIFMEKASDYKVAAEKGNAEAQLYFGLCYLYGAGIEQSNEKAIYWLEEAAIADQYDEVTLFFLAISYANGKNVAKDTDIAAFWYMKIVDMGNMGLQVSESSILRVALEQYTNLLLGDVDPFEGADKIKDKIKSRSRISNVTSGQTTYLSAGTSDVSFSSSGGTRTISISTDGSSWDVSLLPSWCSVSKSESSLTLSCESNSGVARTDWFKVTSGSKEARINVSQEAGVQKPSATIENIWVEHNFFCGYNRKCLKIHIKFSVRGMLNKRGTCNAYFYFQNDVKLKDYNRRYYTADGQVSVGDEYTPGYESAIYNDFTLVIPHDEFHLGRGAYYLKFQVHILDNNKNLIASSEFVPVTYIY